MVETIRQKLMRQGRFDETNKQSRFFNIKKNCRCMPDGMTVEEENQYWEEWIARIT